jgi:hypothetical protein
MTASRVSWRCWTANSQEMVTPEQPVTKLEPTRSARMPPQLLPPRRPRQQKHKLLIVRAMLRRHALKQRGCADA